MRPAAALASDAPGVLTVADMCRLEPTLFCASSAPVACTLLQWPDLNWAEPEHAERLAA